VEKLTDLWQRYTEKRDPIAREALILHYTSWVKYLVSRLSLGFPDSMELDDLVSFGIVGLIDAIDHFNPAHNVKFETYATPRIRGQIIDSLRALDLIPRTARRYAREIELAIADLSQILGRTPIDEEVANHLSITLVQYHSRLMIANCAIVSLDRQVSYENGESFSMYDSLEDESMPSPAEQLDANEMKNHLVSAISVLEEREQLILSLYYNDELTMKEIGEVLGVSESRVSQIHARALLTLRSKINKASESTPVIYNRRGLNAPIYASAR
jgi:RNA polymerase sigma factor FliA